MVRLRSGPSRVLVEVVAELHNMMITGLLHTARSVSHNLYAQKTTVLQILHSVLRMFPYRFHQVHVSEPGDNQQHVDSVNFFLIRYNEDSRWLLWISWMNEAHFTLTGNVNYKNSIH